MLRNILFYIKEAFLSTKKNGIMSLATIISLIATLIIVGVFLLIFLNIELFMNQLESQLVVIAYLEENLSETEIKQLSQELAELEGVKKSEYISKEEAFQRLKDDLTGHEEILAGIPQNPLPSSIEVIVSQSDYLKEIAFQLKQYHGVEEVNYGDELTEKLITVFQFIRKTGLVMISILVFIAILIMVSVIKLSVHSRQKEIEIMALVGATNWFIRWPFIIEGFLKGLFSSIIAAAVLIKTYFFYLEKIKIILPFLPIMSDQLVLLKAMLTIFLLGTMIGIIGSMISLRKISYEQS